MFFLWQVSPICFQFWELAFRQIKMNATIPEDTRLFRCIFCFCKPRVTNSYIVYFLVPLVLLSLFWKGQQSTKVACQRTRAQFHYEKVTGVHWPKRGMIYSARKIVQTVFCISTAKTLQAVKDNLTKRVDYITALTTDTETEQGFIWSTNQQQSTLLLRTCKIRMQRRPSSQCKKAQSWLLGLKSINWLG